MDEVWTRVLDILLACFLRDVHTVVQELGREGVLPFSSFFASNKPFGAPFGGLFEQWLVTSGLVLLIPPGDAYLFMLSRSCYHRVTLRPY